jgi:hypothetical protein
MHVARATLIIALSWPATAFADAKAECIAAADQAQQARDDGRYRAAREGFISCARAVCPKVVAASCTKWSRELEDGMPSLVLGAKDPRGADITDARVTFDGSPLASALDGKPVEVDPGSHKLRFEREGSESVQQTIVIKAGEKLRPISVTLRPVAPVTSGGGDVKHEEEQPSKGSGNGGRMVATVALGVVAAGALASGVVFGVSSQGDADSATKIRASIPSTQCLGTAGSSAVCQSLSNAVDAQNRDATLSVVMYVAGGVLGAVAIVTWLAWPRAKTEHVSWVVGPGAIGIRGTF